MSNLSTRTQMPTIGFGLLTRPKQKKARFTASVIAGFLIAGNALFQPTSANAEAKAQIEKLASQFANAFWIESTEDLMATIHPDLSKKGVSKNYRKSGNDVMGSLPPDRLEVLAVHYNDDGRLDKIDGIEIKFHEVMENVASIEQVNDRWYDFFHAVKLNEKWVLLNCVYGGSKEYASKDPSADKLAITGALETYIEGLAGDKSKVDATTHVNLERRMIGSLINGTQFIDPLPRETLLLKAGNYGINPVSTQIEIYNFTQRAAGAKINVGPWTELVQLLKFNDDWKIVNSFVVINQN